MNPQEEAAWAAFGQHGRAGVGRPRKGSPVPTLAQLGVTKWDARRALALSRAFGTNTLSDEDQRDLATSKRGRSLTAVIEGLSRQGRRRNPLFRAWRVAMQAEREEFLEAIKQLAFLAERADALKGDQ